MIDNTSIYKILNGKFNCLAREDDVNLYKLHYVKFVGNSNSQDEITRMQNSCSHTPGTWKWYDGVTSVFDIVRK